MGIDIITGRLGSGKSYKVFSRIKNIISSGLKGILIVPEQYTLQAERELIDFLNIPGLLDVEVLSPSRLMDNVFKEMGGRLPSMDSQGKAMILRMIIGGLKNRLSVFSSLSNSSGLAASLSDLISDLKRFDISPSDLLSGASGNGLLSMKLNDIALIYESYNSFLMENRFHDAEDNMQAFLDVLSACTYFDDKHIFVDEFDYLPPRTVRFLIGIYEKSASMTITAPTCPGIKTS